jgi:hypothetical protein
MYETPFSIYKLIISLQGIVGGIAVTGGDLTTYIGINLLFSSSKFWNYYWVQLIGFWFQTCGNLAMFYNKPVEI